MRILIIHNKYQQKGGEDSVVAREVGLLQRYGHTPIEYYRSNLEIDTLKLWQKATLPTRTIWANDAYQGLRQLIEREKPDIAHIHNTFSMISPSACYACHQAGIPVVQTLHNYRLLCPDANFFRNGQICEKCLHKTPPWPGIQHGCYHHSRVQTAVIVTMLTVHRWLRTWQKQVNLFITPSAFAREKFIHGGISPQKILVKPHFIDPDPGLTQKTGTYALFVGRLSEEKGIRMLLQAWTQLPPIPLKIVGDGPLKDDVQTFIQTHNLASVNLLGQRPSKEVATLMKQATCLIFPSECFETFGLTAVESFACGTPVIASRLGAIAEIVDDNRTGLHFSPGHSGDLATKLEWVWQNRSQVTQMGIEARKDYENKYTAESNYPALMNIYQQAVQQNAGV